MILGNVIALKLRVIDSKKQYLKLLYLKFRDEFKSSVKIFLNLRRSIFEFQNLIIRFFKFR